MCCICTSECKCIFLCLHPQLLVQHGSADFQPYLMVFSMPSGACGCDIHTMKMAPSQMSWAWSYGEIGVCGLGLKQRFHSTASQFAYIRWSFNESWYGGNFVMSFVTWFHAVLEIPTGPPVRGRQLWRRTGNFLLIFLWFYVYDLRFKTLGPTTFLTEFPTLIPCVVSHLVSVAELWVVLEYLYFSSQLTLYHT